MDVGAFIRRRRFGLSMGGMNRDRRLFGVNPFHQRGQCEKQNADHKVQPKWWRESISTPGKIFLCQSPRPSDEQLKTRPDSALKMREVMENVM
jgi:hypothetical protein